MKNLNQEKGFTLVEVLVAMAILMIIIFTFTVLYTSSFAGIARAGKVSEELFNAQKDMDNIIAEGLETLPEETPPEMEIEFVDGVGNVVHTVKVKGEEKEVFYEHEERSGTLKYFLPEGQ